MTKKMSSPGRNKCLIKSQVFAVVFITIVLMTKICFHINPEWDPFESLGLDDEGFSLEGNNTPTSTGSLEEGGIIIVGNKTSEESVINDPSSPDPSIEYEDSKDIPFTLVTGASANHFCPLKSFLYQTHETIKEYKNGRVIVYDLGLDESQQEILGRMQKDGFLYELKPFNWSAYPAFWNIKVARGEYAWKPGMVYEISKEYPGIIIWLDSGTKGTEKFFENLGGFLEDFNGFVSPRSPGSMKTWTHKGVYDYFNDDHTKYDDLPNCNGAAMAFDTKNSQSLIDAWYQCALDKNCIAPPGSSRRNHRQDQALLTYLAAREGRVCDQSRTFFGLNIHDDGHCKEEIVQYESEHDIIYI